jgi:hypothetical protein
MAAKKKAGRAKKATKKAVRPRAAAKKKTTAKKVAKKKVSKSGDVIRQGDKAAFVRGLPRSLPASEVVDRAAAKGMIMSKAYVHNIRSAANKAARALMSKEGKKTLKGPKTKLEKQFRELVITLGPSRAKKLLSQVETSLAIAATK